MTPISTDCREPAATVVAAVVEPPTLIRAQRLLLVENDVDARELLAESLRDAGYEVEEAGDGREALTAIMRERPSLLITDCNMPNMTGNELLETLALDDRFPSIPTIVVSAVKQPLLPANVLVVLPKPFKMEQLRAAVRKCLAGSPSDCSDA